jgi:signal transduction histidine kinase
MFLSVLCPAKRHTGRDPRAGCWRGISPEKLERVFDRFHRGDEASTIPGFGLGLSIAKTLVDGMGGEIVMESELGRGSTVIVRFST